MTTAVIVYHKNISTLYKKEWLYKFRESILNQTNIAFSIQELNYGGTEERIFRSSKFESIEMPTFVHALNYLLDKCFNEKGYDCCANTNVDDWYTVDRLKVQLPYIESGFDIVSSNFALIKDDEVIKTHAFDKLDIALELSNNHNCVCHPSVVYSRHFWGKNRYVPEQQPLEDLMLWQRSIKNGYSFKIVPNVLCFHRLHNQSVGFNSKEV